MDRPLKKQKRLDVSSLYSVTIFRLALPFLFPGSYGFNVLQAFRTYLALCGVCAKLRYWNILRRWVGYLCPPRLRAALKSHSFPVTTSLNEMNEFQLRARDLLSEVAPFTNVHQYNFSSYWLLNNFFDHEAKREMDLVIGGIPFFNVVQCETVSRSGKQRIICFLAPSFAEMVLFCYAACLSGQKDLYYFAVANWKTSSRYESVLIEGKSAERFLNRYLLGRLKRVGLTAPQELGFVAGQLPQTAYSWFSNLCDTNGTRSKMSPKLRLHNFVSSWFPQNFDLTEEQAKNAPYVMKLKNL